MKKITLFLGLLMIASHLFSQNACPTVNIAGITTVTDNGTSCVYRAFANATGTAARKNIRLQVYNGSAANLIVDECIEITRNQTGTYFTNTFVAACNATLVLVVTRYTSSNGTCDGNGTCGADTLGAGGGPTVLPTVLLPIKMKAFYAKRKNATVGLSWQTEFELNAKEFVVQRRIGNEFVTVGNVPALNKANGGLYSFNDANSNKGVSLYRLKLVDQDGTYHFSEIRSVKGTNAAADFTIYPNPSKGDAKVTITDISGPTDVQLIDNAGRVIKVVSMNNSNTADFNNLQKGFYLVRILNKESGESVTKKLNVIQ